MSVNSYLEIIPDEIFYKILLENKISNIFSLMQANSLIYNKLRYNNYFWEKYYKKNYSQHILYFKLGDFFKSCIKIHYYRFDLAEKIIDIIFDIKSTNNITLYIYGGYLRDKIIKNINFKNINICIVPSDYIRFIDCFLKTMKKYPEFIIYHNHNIIKIHSSLYVIELDLISSTLKKLPLDFDINSLYLLEKNEIRTRAVEIINSNWLTDSYIEHLKNIKNNCKNKCFNFCLVNTNSLDSLIKRYEYMIQLGFKFLPNI